MKKITQVYRKETLVELKLNNDNIKDIRRYSIIAYKLSHSILEKEGLSINPLKKNYTL
jgi:hypothetical protein